MKPNDQQQEHTGSYYAATVNEITAYPELQGAHTADVCVVGAGFTGVSTALTLAERGYAVALIEANRVGWGASGRNGGTTTSASFLPRFSPLPCSNARCGSYPPNQKQNGLSAGRSSKKASTLWYFLPATERFLSVPGPNALR